MPEAPLGPRQEKTGKMFLGLMSLDFSGNFQMVGSVFEINSMNAVSPAFRSSFRPVVVA